MYARPVAVHDKAGAGEAAPLDFKFRFLLIMKTLLCCTDGSIYAEGVYDHTAWAARRSGAGVLVLHTIEPNAGKAASSDWSRSLGFETRQDLLEETVRLEEARHRLDREKGGVILEHATGYLRENGVQEVKAEQRHGSLVEVVAELERNADMVVVGKRGESADFAKSHLGSNLERVIRASVRPILVASRAFRPINRCLIAYDGGLSIERGLRFLQSDSLLSGVECLLLRTGRIDDKAKWYVEEACEKLRDAGYEARTLIIEGNVDDVIEKTVKEEQCDLLAMGAYGHSQIRRLIIGSTTATMIRVCPVPVLLFR